eukprot:jgi/Chlat1/4922/Chrsp31S04785
MAVPAEASAAAAAVEAYVQALSAALRDGARDATEADALLRHGATTLLHVKGQEKEEEEEEEAAVHGVAFGLMLQRQEAHFFVAPLSPVTLSNGPDLTSLQLLAGMQQARSFCWCIILPLQARCSQANVVPNFYASSDLLGLPLARFFTRVPASASLLALCQALTFSLQSVQLVKDDQHHDQQARKHNAITRRAAAAILASRFGAGTAGVDEVLKELSRESEEIVYGDRGGVASTSYGRVGVSNSTRQPKSMLQMEARRNEFVNMLVSLPERAGTMAPRALMPRSYFPHLISKAVQLCSKDEIIDDIGVGVCQDVLARLCRRGQAPAVASALLESTCDHRALPLADSYALEKVAESLLRLMAARELSDGSANNMLKRLFGQVFNSNQAVRYIFSNKLLVRLVLPRRSLRWVVTLLASHSSPPQRVDTATSIADEWASKALVQNASPSQHVYLSAALAAVINTLTPSQLESAPRLIPSLLQGVSTRLDSPVKLSRLMGMRVARAFSTVLDPSKPLLFDEERVEGGEVVCDVWDTRWWCDGSVKVGSDIGVKVGKATAHAAMDVDDEEDDDAMFEIEHTPLQLYSCAEGLRKDDLDAVEGALKQAERLVRARPDELEDVAAELARALVYARVVTMDEEEENNETSPESHRMAALVALLVEAPLPTVQQLVQEFYSPHTDTSQRLMVLDAMTAAAMELAALNTSTHTHLSQPESGVSALEPVAGVNKTRVWGHVSLRKMKQPLMNAQKNRFGDVALAYALPLMKDFDRRTQGPLGPEGLDLLRKDFVVLGRMLHALGVFADCAAHTTCATTLCTAVLELILSRQVAMHVEPFVRRNALFAAERSLSVLALHPSAAVSAMAGGSTSLASALDGVRGWAEGLLVLASAGDGDPVCRDLALATVKTHAELAAKALEEVQEMAASQLMPSPTELLRGGKPPMITLLP